MGPGIGAEEVDGVAVLVAAAGYYSVHRTFVVWRVACAVLQNDDGGAADDAEVVEDPKAPEKLVAAVAEAADILAEPWAEEDPSEGHMAENNQLLAGMDYMLAAGREAELAVGSSGVLGGIAVVVVVPAAAVVAAAAIAFDYFVCHSHS